MISVWRLVLMSVLSINLVVFSKKAAKSLVENLSDHKDFKKLLRTKNNVLVVYAASATILEDKQGLLKDVSLEVKGLGTVVAVNCGDKDGKKFCKKMKVAPTSFELKHYQNGEFHKDYDRAVTLKSIVNFLKDPKGDLPWDEDAASKDVVHLANPAQFNKLLKTEKGKVLVMFYAPWCGHCKRMKPDYQAAATEVKKSAVLAAMDANIPENSPVSRRFNITGFPTLLYFKDGELQFPYPAGNNKEEILKFLANPQAEAAEKPKDEAWADTPSEVVHLTDSTFDEFMSTEPSVLVMFYAPWCGHCKRAKPHFILAAAELKHKGIPGRIAAVDCTLEKELTKRFEVRGFPSIKYFKDGEMAFEAGDARETEAIVKFMSDPKEPPPPPPPEQPWSDTETEVIHLTDETFKPFLKKKKHVLVMFYAPWCGHCKSAKPHYEHAAAELKENVKVAFAAVDCTIHRSVCSAYEVNGFPTFKYFNYFKDQKPYSGGRTKKDFVAFMKDPLSLNAGQEPPPPSAEEQWAEVQGSLFIKHLRGDEFDHYMKYKDVVLVMFYAPWCGHCKSMKADYARAAEQLTNAKVPHVLAAVDATQERDLANRFSIKGYPTIKFFRRGNEVEDYDGGRKTKDLVSYIEGKVADLRNEL